MSTTLGLLRTELGALVIAVAEALRLRRIVSCLDVLLVNICLKELDQEVNSVAFMEILLNANSDLHVSSYVSAVGNRHIEVLIGEVGVVRIIYGMLNVSSVPDTTVSEVDLVGSARDGQVNYTLRLQGFVIEAFVRGSAVLNLKEESEAAIGRSVARTVLIREVQCAHKDKHGTIKMILSYLEADRGLLHFERLATGQSVVSVHTLSHKLPLLSIVDTDFNVVGWLSCSLLFRLLSEHLDDTRHLWYKSHHVILFVVHSVNVSNVEFASVKLAHVLNSVEVIRVVDPTAFLVEDIRLESALGEDALSLGRIAVQFIMVAIEELMDLLRIVDVCGRSTLSIAVWERENLVRAVVTEATSVAIIALTFNLALLVDPSLLW